MVKSLYCGIVVSEFELQSRFYVHFRTNTLRKGMNFLILLLFFLKDGFEIVALTIRSNNRKVPMVLWLTSWTASSLSVSSNSSHAIKFTFGLKPFGEVVNSLAPHLWVKFYHYCSSTSITLALKTHEG